MSGEKKKGGKSFLKTIKKGIEDTTIAAGLETEYLKGKTQGFPHPTEVEEQIDIMRGLRDEIPTIRGRVSDVQSYEKSISEAEGKMGNDFIEAIDKKMQHPDLKTIYKSMGEYKTTISGKRYQYQVTLEEIKDEWKNLETTDLHNIKKNKMKLIERFLIVTFGVKKIILLKLKKKKLNIRLLLLK